jgi:hypothetical protein
MMSSPRELASQRSVGADQGHLGIRGLEFFEKLHAIKIREPGINNDRFWERRLGLSPSIGSAGRRTDLPPETG